MLFPHIVHKLIKENIDESEIEFCDVVSRNMVEFGGHNIKSIADFIDYTEAVNVIHVGGEIGSCTLGGALHMCNPLSSINEIEVNKLNSLKLRLAYLLPKSLFKKSNKFITNSVAGRKHSAISLYKEYDFVGLRDRRSDGEARVSGVHCNLIPDSAVMTRHFFGDTISARSSASNIKNLNEEIGEDYIAVQLKQRYIDQSKSLAESMKKIISKTNLPIVFFCAGIAPNHDSLDLYKKTFKDLPNDRFHFFGGLNIWDICNVISNAKCVIGTSLHVRILAQQYCRPRVTLGQQSKHKQFMRIWDNTNNANVTLDKLSDYIQRELKEHDYEADEKQLKFLEHEYLTKSTWINLLK
jgi:hypothetical protein